MRYARPLSAAAAVLILAASGFLALRLRSGSGPEPAEASHGAPPVTVRVAVVRAGILAETLQVTGTLRPLPGGESRVAAQVAGRVESVRVRPGQVVAAGELLASLRRPDLHSLARVAEAGVRETEQEVAALEADRAARAQAIPLQEARATADLEAARARRDRLRAGSRPEEIERAEAALQAAQAELDRLRAGTRPQEIAQAEAAVRDARAGRGVLEKDLARKRALLEKGIVAVRDVERLEADVAAAAATLEARLQALSLARAGFRPEEIRAQEHRVREAQAQEKQTRAGYRTEEIREGEAALAAAAAAVEQARAARSELRTLDRRLRAARSRIDAAREQARATRETAGRVEVRSPLAGVVVQVLVSPGDGVSEQTPVAIVLNREAFRAVLEVPAGRISSAAPGTAAEIRVPGLPGALFRGSVRALLSEATPETGFIPAEVWIADPAHRLAEGMSVNARLLTRRAGRGILAPTSALFAREGEQFVYRIDKDEVREQAVEVGREQGAETEILRGLRAGDRVAQDGSLSLADGAKVAPLP